MKLVFVYMAKLPKLKIHEKLVCVFPIWKCEHPNFLFILCYDPCCFYENLNMTETLAEKKDSTEHRTEQNLN